ncbi:hypothetical protein ACTMU2_37540 [Cupriavidus basilensis]
MVHAGVQATMADHTAGAAASTILEARPACGDRRVQDQPAARRAQTNACAAAPTMSSRADPSSWSRPISLPMCTASLCWSAGSVHHGGVLDPARAATG